MDNHRAALWCWFQHIKPSEILNLFHIDKHNDTLAANLASWVSQCPDLYTTDLKTYLSLNDSSFSEFDASLFRWDNYASIFLEKYKNQVDCCYFATYGEGDKPNHQNIVEVEPWLLNENIDYWMDESSNKWICNVDLDYFFHKLDERKHRMYSDQFIIDLFSKIKTLLDNDKIIVLTVCFSPECCGSWEKSEEIWSIIQPCLGTNMLLPP